MTKLEMAQVIVKKLYNVKHTPKADNVNVKRIAKKSKTELKSLMQYI